jgi:HPt (histidine-containing phosphotransfer) domain-containing protein
MSIKYFKNSLLLEMLDGNTAEVAEMANMFIELAPIMLSDIEVAIASNDFLQASKQAHKLKSSLRLWQMNQMAELASSIEQLGENNTEKNKFIDLFSPLKQGVELALEQMKEEYQA